MEPTQTPFWQTLTVAIITSSLLTSIITTFINYNLVKYKENNSRAQRILDKVCDILLSFIHEDRSLLIIEMTRIKSAVPRLEGLNKKEAADKLQNIIKTWNLIGQYDKEGNDIDGENEKEKFPKLVEEISKIRF